MLGGFDLTFSDEEEELGDQGNMRRLLPNLVQFDLPDYIGDLAGFEALLCLARYIHQHKLGIERLSIE
ncbi:MAG: hypothetical protein KZQ76_10305 [Candidatus Thiodiazotropha sp. (ex Epidulcina cf. delphinae)]|nr:hypothetical protein [Candidatus Thiodiazotropha sp. (ex Epidulcina cf. delphinae)]